MKVGIGAGLGIRMEVRMGMKMGAGMRVLGLVWGWAEIGGRGWEKDGE